MLNDVIVLMAEDDLGHAGLIRKNLKRAGITNDIVHFKDGQEVLDFLFDYDHTHEKPIGHAYLLLLDIRMPKVDGVEVLKRIKEDPDLKAIPVLMLTTTDDPKEVSLCHKLGCSNYITKPIEYKHFVKAVNHLGLFLRIVDIPKIDNQ
ncbi:response regulator [Planctomycetota bacterium]